MHTSSQDEGALLKELSKLEEMLTAQFSETENLSFRLEKEEQKKRERERRMQEALLTIKKKYGKNAVLRGMNFEEGATAKERNGQIGGHQA